MPAKTSQNDVRTPPYCRQRVKDGHDRAFVTLSGKRHWLGRWNSPESKAEYRRLISDWLTHGGRIPTKPQELTIAELSVAFLRHAKKHYRLPDGRLSSEYGNFTQAIGPLDALYGDQPAADFGPNALRAVRNDMVRRGWARPHINKQINRIRHIFRWAVGQELVAAAVWHGLQAVEPLKRGRCDARETDPIRPVPDAYHWEFDLCRLTLGNFRYRKVTLVRDYTDLQAENIENPAFDATFSLVPRPVETETPPAFPLEERFHIVSCDPTQATAISLARAGTSYIIQGPPGTGSFEKQRNWPTCRRAS